MYFLFIVFLLLESVFSEWYDETTEGNLPAPVSTSTAPSCSDYLDEYTQSELESNPRYSFCITTTEGTDLGICLFNNYRFRMTCDADTPCKDDTDKCDGDTACCYDPNALNIDSDVLSNVLLGIFGGMFLICFLCFILTIIIALIALCCIQFYSMRKTKIYYSMDEDFDDVQMRGVFGKIPMAPSEDSTEEEEEMEEKDIHADSPAQKVNADKTNEPVKQQRVVETKEKAEVEIVKSDVKINNPNELKKFYNFGQAKNIFEKQSDNSNNAGPKPLEKKGVRPKALSEKPNRPEKPKEKPNRPEKPKEKPSRPEKPKGKPSRPGKRIEM